MDTSFDHSALEQAVERAAATLSTEQTQEGYFRYELEADATIPAEYVLLEHYLGRIDEEVQQKIGNYLRRTQADSEINPGGWPLFEHGRIDISATVKAYFALKAIGDAPDAPHMAKARAAILALGGAERSNVFTRILLAFFGAVPWRACPVVPIELMLAPNWFPFAMRKIAYWSRTTLVPLMVIMALRQPAKNPRGIRVDELFVTPPDQIKDWIRGPFASPLGRFFKGLDVVLQKAQPFFPKKTRQRAIDKAVPWIKERLNGEDGVGAIFPPMVNTIMMYDALGMNPSHPDYAVAWKALRKLLVIREDEAYCQPCLSPIWDTSLAGHALVESGNRHQAKRTCDWLKPKQILDVYGDWAEDAPGVAPGGWAFQYENPHYPDVDDTAVVGMLLHRLAAEENAQPIERARQWILGMQCANGGWGAFDVNNDSKYLNEIPFADHGAMLDPPTEDVTGRCISFLAQLGYDEDRPAIDHGIKYLRTVQTAEGAWWGRWGTNYIYGTWSVLCALNAAGLTQDDPMVARAAAWLVAKQRLDGGWGEDCESYFKDVPAGEYHGPGATSLPTQTAWAILGLMAAGRVDDEPVRRGVAYLQSVQGEDGSWTDPATNAVGFPRMFYLKYHGYARFFPLLALSRYKNLLASNDRLVKFGF